MKLKLSFSLLLLFPVLSFAQTVTTPFVSFKEAGATTIEKIDVTPKNTVITFKHITGTKGNWVELNKSIYLQDANGEDRYNFLKAEGIPLRPAKHYAANDNDALIFKVYFEKLKPGTKSINIIERALSPMERNGNLSTYFNFYGVSLDKSATAATNMVIDTIRSTDGMARAMDGMGPMIDNMYNQAFKTKLKFYSNPDNLAQMAKATKDYYDALIKAGFGADQALKIVTSKPLVSPEDK